jgi:hypothetical protein
VDDAYGWGDLNLGHDFQETKQGTRFTISEEAHREVLDRLLLLNHERLRRRGRAGPPRYKKPMGKGKKQESGQEER